MLFSSPSCQANITVVQVINVIQPVIEHCDLTALTAATDDFIIFAQALKLTYL